MKYCVLIMLFFFGLSKSYGNVKLPSLIKDSMVLQRDTKIKIWGWAQASEKITISFLKKKFKTIADKDGKWTVLLSPQNAGGPYEMKIKGNNEIIIKEILIGDVWFCSGQSNMVHQMNIHDVTYAKEIIEANYPQIRQFLIPTLTSLTGAKEDLPACYWKSAVGEDVRPFSAVAYFFAKKLYEKYHFPIGIINASVGGTPIEAWISEEGLKDFSVITDVLEKNKDTAYINNILREMAAANVKRQRIPSQDRGSLSSPKWYELNYNPTGWKNIAVPGYWEDQGIKDLNGVVWYRKEIDVPASMTGKPSQVFLGRIVDADFLYINGIQIGNTTYLYPQRRYTIPAGVLKFGKNIVVVKATNNSGKGGFVPDKPYSLFTGNDTIDLKGYWQYKVGEVFVPTAENNSVANTNLQNQPMALYNAMVAPVVNYSIKGFVWYQGESNASRAKEYAALQKAQINNWRNKWQLGDIPFLYVQLPNYMDANYLPSESQWALLREAQLKTLSVSNTAMAVGIDLGEWNDIHPDNKKDVGERLALAAQKKAYGENIVFSGPIFENVIVENNKMIVSFTHSETGLITNDGEELKEFTIAGADKKFVWAKARIVNNKVIVWSEEIAKPLYVRYAWADNPTVNFYNKAGLPASPFRTDQ